MAQLATANEVNKNKTELYKLRNQGQPAIPKHKTSLNFGVQCSSLEAKRLFISRATTKRTVRAVFQCHES